MRLISLAAFISEFQDASEKRPYHFVAALLTTLVLTLLVIPWILTLLNINDYLPALIGEILATASAVFFMNWLGWWERLGYTARIHKHDLLDISVPFIFISLPALLGLLIVVATGTLRVPPSDLLYFALQALMLGFIEETFFRGFILQAFLSQGLIRAVLFSAVLFTISHLASIFNGSDLLYVFAQILLSIGWGCSFAVLWIRSRALWPLIAMHCLRDFCSLTIQENQGAAFTNQTYGWAILSSICISMLLLFYSFWLLRPIRLQQMRDRYSAAKQSPPSTSLPTNSPEHHTSLRRP